MLSHQTIPQPILDAALETQNEVAYKMVGRLGDPARRVAALAASFAVMAGDGDHCEIGVLYGGSAITTALLKERLGCAGMVIGIDPFDGYYVGSKTQDVDQLDVPNSELAIPITMKTAVDNAVRFGIRRRTIFFKAKSHPWPASLLDVRFSTAFIDGDHWGDGPWNDFVNLQSRVDRFIMFDNVYDGTAYGVRDVSLAIEIALIEYPEWKLAYEEGAFSVLERTSL